MFPTKYCFAIKPYNLFNRSLEPLLPIATVDAAQRVIMAEAKALIDVEALEVKRLSVFEAGSAKKATGTFNGEDKD